MEQFWLKVTFAHLFGREQCFEASASKSNKSNDVHAVEVKADRPIRITRTRQLFRI